MSKLYVCTYTVSPPDSVTRHVRNEWFCEHPIENVYFSPFNILLALNLR